MTYQKPANLKYTDMAIFVDNNIYSANPDHDTCFQYIYHLYAMLAYKLKLFSKSNDYDLFALYSATQVMLRYLNPKHARSDAKIKSILNYVKRSVRGLAFNFRTKYYSEQFNCEYLGDDKTSVIKQFLYQDARALNYQYSKADIEAYFLYMPRLCSKIIQDTPYASNFQEKHYLYLSILLTMINSLSPRPQKNPSNSIANDNIVLYHLPEHMSNLVATLVNKCRKMISNDLAYLIKSNTLPDNLIHDILRPNNLQDDEDN